MTADSTTCGDFHHIAPPRFWKWSTTVLLALLVILSLSQSAFIVWMYSPWSVYSGALGATSMAGLDFTEMWEERGVAGGVVGGVGTGVPSAAPVQSPSPERHVVRSVSVVLTTPEFESVRPRVDTIVRDSGGTLQSVATETEPNQPRTLNAEIHVPASSLDASLTAVRAMGHVVREQQDASDVTGEVLDLDARLLNLTNAEDRIRGLLQVRTGTLADVLAAERELTRIRGELKSLHSQRNALGHTVTFARIRLLIREERTAALDVGRAPLLRRVRNAVVDGGSLAGRAAIGAVLGVLRFGPPIAVIGAFLFALVHVFRVLRRRRLGGSTAA